MEIRSNLQAFLPILFLGIAAGISGILFHFIVAPTDQECSLKFAIHDPEISALCDNNGNYLQPFDELKNRMLWALSVLFFALAYIINTYLVVKILRKLKVYKKWRFYFIKLIFLGNIGIIFLPADEDFTFNIDLIAPLNNSILIEWIVNRIEYSGAFMLFILAFTCFFILKNANWKRKKMYSFDINANLLFRNDRNTRLLLYGATLTLIAGTLHSAAVYNWSLTMIEPAILISNSENSIKYYEEASQVSSAMGALNGMFYTMLMITIFAPTFLILRNKSMDLAKKANPNKSQTEIQNWLKSKNLDQGFSEQIIPILSTLGPALIGGPLISLLEII